MRKIEMHIEVDQSGKIEHLNMDMVIAFSNQHQYSIVIRKSIKREIYIEYKGRVKNLRYKLFCIGIYHCLKDYLHEYQRIVIDVEYKGKENLIKSILLGLIRKSSKSFDSRIIHFGSITKKSNAHAVAIDVFRGHRKPNKIVSPDEVIQFL